MTPPTSTYQPVMTLPTSTYQPGMAPPISTDQPGMTPPNSVYQPAIPPTNTYQPGMTSTHITNAQYTKAIYQAQQPNPARQKPDFGSFVFASLLYLDSRVSRCYGCGELLKPGGVLPPPPNDLVLTTRLHRKYYKNGQLQISPSISSVYLHVNSQCVRAAFAEFTPACCNLPRDLVPFLLKEHYDLMFAKLGLNFAQNV